jgi:alpha-tubulin suppressor-like RCC1 family protein
VWGDNSYGQLGLSGGDRGAPQELTLPLEPDVAVASVAAGDRHSLVLTSDGKVWAFGDDSLGQLGDGSSSARHEAAIVPGLSAVSAIAAGSAFNLALRDDGTVWTWGSNACGEVGQAPSVGRLASPKQVSSLGGVTAIAAGACHAVVLTSRGTLEVWGANDRGQLGLGAPSGRVTKPTEVSLLDDVVTIAAGAFHTLALRSDGSIWGFGDDSAGQLGGTAGQGAVPRRLTSESAADLIAAGFSHSLYASFPGEVHAWGLGRAGQLGVGDGRDYFDAQRVDIGGVRWLTAGGSHTLFGVELPP